MRFAPAGDWFPSKNLGAVLIWSAEVDLATLSSRQSLEVNARKGSICLAPYRSALPSLSHEKERHGAVP